MSNFYGVLAPSLTAIIEQKAQELRQRGKTEEEVALYTAGYAEGWTRARLVFEPTPQLSRHSHDD